MVLMRTSNRENNNIFPTDYGNYYKIILYFDLNFRFVYKLPVFAPFEHSPNSPWGEGPPGENHCIRKTHL